MTLKLVQFEYAWEIHAYLRLAGIYYEEENRDYPISVAEGKKAFLIDGPFIVDGDRALKYLKEKYTNIDLDYSEVEQAEISIYSHVLETVGKILVNKRKWTQWGNLKKTVFSVYQPVIGFPYSIYYASQKWNEMSKKVQSFQKVTEQSDDEMLELLLSVYSFVNEKLKSQEEPDFIFGYRPSTLDVMLIAHLACLREPPETILHFAQAYPAMMDYYERMLYCYFSSTSNNDGVQLSTNPFVLGNHLSIEHSKKELNPVQRRVPYEEEKEEEENEEERMMREEEERLRKTMKWRIGLFSILAAVGVIGFVCSGNIQLEDDY